MTVTVTVTVIVTDTVTPAVTAPVSRGCRVIHDGSDSMCNDDDNA